MNFGGGNRILDLGVGISGKYKRSDPLPEDEYDLLDLPTEHVELYYDEIYQLLFENKSENIYYPDTLLRFGKYKIHHKTIEYIIEHDIGYFWWCIEHNCFKLSKDVKWSMIKIIPYLKHKELMNQIKEVKIEKEEKTRVIDIIKSLHNLDNPYNKMYLRTEYEKARRNKEKLS